MTGGARSRGLESNGAELAGRENSEWCTASCPLRMWRERYEKVHGEASGDVSGQEVEVFAFNGSYNSPDVSSVPPVSLVRGIIQRKGGK